MGEIEIYKYRYNLYNYIKNDSFMFKITNDNIEFYRNFLLFLFICIFIIILIYIRKLNYSSVFFVIIFIIYINYIFIIQTNIDAIINNKFLNMYNDYYKLLNVIYLENKSKELDKEIEKNIKYIENRDYDEIIEDLKTNLDFLKYCDLDNFLWNYIDVDKNAIDNFIINDNYNSYKGNDIIDKTENENKYRVFIRFDETILKTLAVKHREYIEDVEKMVIKYINEKYKTDIKSLKNLNFYKNEEIFTREINKQINIFNNNFLILIILTIILISLIIHIITNNYIISSIRRM
jgi:hypothetical protein